MKKNLIYGTLVLCLATLFVACKQERVELQAIDIQPAQLQLQPEQTQRLTVTLTPSTITSYDIEWTTSNAEVATVNEIGVVTAIGYGTAEIKAKVFANGKTLEGICSVRVVDFFEALQFTQCCPYLFEVTPDSTVVDITASTGEVIKCYVCDASFIAFSQGLYLDNNGYFQGADLGAYIEYETKVFWGNDELNGAGKGGFFCLGIWEVTNETRETRDESGVIDKIGEPGKYSADYASILKQGVEAYNAVVEANKAGDETAYNDAYSQYQTASNAAGAEISGAQLHVLVNECDESGSCGYYSASFPGSVPYGLVNSARFDLISGEDGNTDIMIKLDYANAKYQLFDSEFGGLDCDYSEETRLFTINSDKINLSDEIESSYGVPYSYDSEAPRYIEVKMMPQEQVEKLKLAKQRVFDRTVEHMAHSQK